MEVKSLDNLNKQLSAEVSLDISEFKQKYFSMLSPYFNNIFSDYFLKITCQKISDKKGKFIFDVKLDEKCANPLGIAHGGALATLMENLASVSLFYFSGKRHKTLDISVNYKNQVELNQVFQVHVFCDKISFGTSFVEVEVRKGDEICTQASMIKSKIGPKL
jgi:acyl-coenzyme A thioesterase PaaI-like protein